METGEDSFCFLERGRITLLLLTHTESDKEFSEKEATSDINSGRSSESEILFSYAAVDKIGP